MTVKKSEGKEKKLVGRPKKYDSGSEAVKRRNITVTDPGWEGLNKVIESNNLTSKSELVELIGRDNLIVLRSQELLNLTNAGEIPVLARLRSLTTKTPYMRSIISFARLVMLRTGVSKGIDYDDDQFIEEIIIEAITSIALRDYVYPNNNVISALADTRWLIFRLILSRSKIILEPLPKQSITKLRGDTNTILNKEVCKIFNSIYHFSINFPSEYQIYEMRMMESLTWEQIRRILKIRGVDLTEDEIRSKNHQAVEKIREVWHEIDIEEMQIRSDLDEIKLKKEMANSLSIAQKYYELITSKDEFTNEKYWQWETFLLKSMTKAKLDLLLPEIHHSWVHRKIDNEVDRETYKEHSFNIMENISKLFEQRLIMQLEKLKQKLKLCGNKRKDIQDVLMNIIPLDIPEDYFLGDRKYSEL